MPRFTELSALLPLLQGRTAEGEQQDRAVEDERLRSRDHGGMDDRPYREAPHHRVPGDRKNAGRWSFRTPGARESRVAAEGADEQDRGEPHEQGRDDPQRVALVPQRRLAPDATIDPDRQAERHERDDHIDGAETLLPEPVDYGLTKRVRQQEVRADERGRGKRKANVPTQCRYASGRSPRERSR